MYLEIEYFEKKTYILTAYFDSPSTPPFMNSLKNILCPVDFSESSYQAIEHASFLAQMLQADLTLMHVVQEQLPGKLGMVHGPDQASQKLIAKATEDARILLREAKRKYVPFAINCKSAVRYGDTIREIVAEAVERNSDILFIPPGLEGVTSNSKSLKLLQSAGCSVMFCKNLGKEKGFRKIVLAQEHEHELKDLAAYLFRNFNLMLQRLHVLVPGGEDAAERLGGWSEELREAGLEEFSSQFISQDLLVDEWVNAGNDHGSQLLVIPMADQKDKNATTRLQQLLQKASITVFVWKVKVLPQAATM